MKVIWTATAMEHLSDIRQFIAKQSPRFAQRMIDRITDRSRQLATFPNSGQVVLDYGRSDVRELIEGPYRIIYCTTENLVAVLAVIHGARQLPDFDDL